MYRKFYILPLLAAPVWAQDSLSLREAARLALGRNQSIAASSAAVKAAGERITQARGGYLPKLNYAESWARSNNPVFVFSSLLTQHQFTMENFQIGPLNRPDFMNNFQSQVTVDQVIYDGGQIRKSVRAAELSRSMSAEEQRAAQMNVIAGVVRAYYGVILAGDNLKVAQEAYRSAEADLARAESVRAVGMSTDADVLSIRVHLASVKEQQIRRAADVDVARSALNDALGLPLDTPHNLSTPLTAADYPDQDLADFEKKGVETRPEAQELVLATSLAETQASLARSSMLPQIGFRAGFEADRQRPFNIGGANWLASVQLRWNLFNGFTDKSRVTEASFAVDRARALSERTGSGIRLEVRRAYADLRAASQRIEVAKTAVDMAQESLRITQNRYQAGLATITELLRNETALLETRTRHLAAIHDQRIAATVLELASGALSADSKILD